MRDDDETIGRGAILLMLVVFVAAVIGTLFLARPAHAIKRQPQANCVASSLVETCRLTAGSTDVSGFVMATTSPSRTGSRGMTLLTVVFDRTRERSCSVRPASISDHRSDEPTVTVASTADSMMLVLAEDTRLPRKMRWFYTCQ